MKARAGALTHELVLYVFHGYSMLSPNIYNLRSQNLGSRGPGMYQQQAITYFGAVITVTCLLRA